tara:strand:+ start:572 stop:1426 length:855 start_codon:yes stop_codon:yes gene_type:complete
MNVKEILNKLILNLKELDNVLTFRILEIGALNLGKKEKFYDLLNYFPNSEIIGFEVDKNICKKMNSVSKVGVKYFPFAIGKKKEIRKFYETNHPMCSSLYKPNHNLLSLYNNMEISFLKEESEIETIDLDTFVSENKIGNVDFLKIDVQGAELDIFKGATKTLKNSLFIISEVEFLKIYENQPLFGDVSNFLSDNDFMFHKFLGMGGRSLKPLILNNNKNFPSQHLWSDAIFIKNVLMIKKLTSREILKLSVISILYECFDLGFFCLNIHDELFKTNYTKIFMK